MPEYRALYRKYRPQRFADVVGQGHVTDTLANEVQQERVAHAYLFAGPRGTGKTSTARILAKALNCTDPADDGEPCSVCDSCQGIIEGTSMDVIELDAASHNKVEDVREIRANVGTVAAAGGARRVYILDEAHMLSRAASNALLKTLEEPPEHAHFVLATTEPYKLPDTIRSRTQRFDFHPIGSEALIAHLERVATAEGLTTAHDSLALITRHAGGSARDALGLLEQVAALGGGTVDARGVTRALGLADADAFSSLVEAISTQSAAAGLGLVSSLASEGADLRRFVADSIEFFRGIFLAQYAPNLEEIVDEPAEVLEEWRTLGRSLTPSDVLRSIDRLGDALVQLRDGREERLVVELAILALTRPETSPDPGALAARIDRLEDRVRLIGERSPAPESPSSSAAAPEPAPADPPALTVVPDAGADDSSPSESSPSESTEVAEPEASEPDPVVEPDPEPAPSAPPVQSGPAPSLEAVDAAWPAIMARVRDEAGMRRHALFREARPAAMDGSRLVLELPSHLPFHLAQLGEDDRLNAVVKAAASDALGTAITLAYRSADGDASLADPTAASTTDAVIDETETEDVPDKDQLMDADDDASDPAGLVIDLLGGEVVEE